MVKTNKIMILKELQKYPVFTAKTIRDITGKERQYGNLILHRLKKAGLIFKLERDKYTVHEDSWIVASNILWPSYISGWAALQYYHLTEQLPWRIDIITTGQKKKREITFGNSRIRFIKTKPEYMFGFRKEHYHGFEIFIAEKEKCIADSFVFKKVSDEELLDIVSKHKEELDIRLITKYIKKMVRRPWAKNAEYFLERLNTHA
ncbi:MAG: hypothetical protein Q7S22_04970 [Candidatus Micrarchaeota archaeon]|nr:hypothetical protein [Candidatus Micrarchaeota archaeon]